MALFTPPKLRSRLDSAIGLKRRVRSAHVPIERSHHNDTIDQAFARMRSNDVIPQLMDMEQARLENAETLRLVKLREAAANAKNNSLRHSGLPDIETVHVEDPTATLDIEGHVKTFTDCRTKVQDDLLKLLVREMATLSAISTAVESVGRISNNAVSGEDIDVTAMRDMTSEMFALSFMKTLGDHAGVDAATLQTALNSRAGLAFAPGTKGSPGGRGGKSMVKEIVEAMGMSSQTRAEPDPAKPKRDPGSHLGVLGKVAQRLGGGSSGGGEGPFGLL